MTYRMHDLSPAERIAFAWHRAPEARWAAWDELPSSEQEFLLKWARLGWPETRADHSVTLAKTLYFRSGERGERYEPFKEEALFREFASLSGDAESLVGFARRFGPLHSREWHASLDFRYDHEQDSPLKGGSSLDFWTSCHAEMRDAVEFFDALTKRTERDVLARAREFVWDPDLRRTPREEVQAALSLLVERYKPASPTLAGDGALQGTGLRLTFGVESLLEAMWLQLALAVDGNRRYKQCTSPNCDKWWDATRAHAMKETCGDACRKALHRHKQKEQTEGATSGE